MKINLKGVNLCLAVEKEGNKRLPSIEDKKEEGKIDIRRNNM